MSMSKHTGGKEMNNLVRFLDPKKCIGMSATEKGATQDNFLHDILKCICALRNSGGGKLTIFLTPSCSKSEAEMSAEIIKNCVNEVLSETTKFDLLKITSVGRIIFLIQGSLELVTMNYNLYVMTSHDMKPVSSKCPAREIKRLLYDRQQELEKANDINFIMQFCKAMKNLAKKIYSSKKHKLWRYESAHVERRAHSKSPYFHKAYSSSPLVLKHGHTSRKLPQFVEDQNMMAAIRHSDGMVKCRKLRDNESGTNSSVSNCRLSLEENKLIAYDVSAIANGLGGHLYYGVSSDGIVQGEEIFEAEKEVIYRGIEKMITSMKWPKHAEENQYWNISFESVNDPNLYVIIKISVRPCLDGVFVETPESYHVVHENRVEKMSFAQWIECLQGSNSKFVSDKSEFIPFKESEKAFDRIFLSIDSQALLNSLDWVERFSIVDENEDCSTRHLEIVCKLGEVPRIADIVRIFGEEILPFVTYREISKRKWFETYIFDKHYNMKEEYMEPLARLPWVQDFYIGATNQPKRTWQIYITYDPKEAPSMADLKKLFGSVNIACFVDFLQGEDMSVRKPLPSSCLLRGPISGDAVYLREQLNGTIGVLATTVATEESKHYAVTCYHVCYGGTVPDPCTLEEAHDILKEDCKNNSPGCRGILYRSSINDQITPLGHFYHGLYDDDNDIALIELDQNENVNCSDAVNFLRSEHMNPAPLAPKSEVSSIFLGRSETRVEIIGAVSKDKTTGILIATSGKGTDGNIGKNCYRIKSGVLGKLFARKGDSGSLVYIVDEIKNKKIPFAYLCMEKPNLEPGEKMPVHYCQDLDYSMTNLLGGNFKPCITSCGRFN